jgi:hypothetical protein
MKLTREQIHDILADKYYKFLLSLPYEDSYYMKAIHEGKGKFLANLHIYLATKDLPKKHNDKRYSTDFITPRAQEIIRTNSTNGLEYEHLVPKKIYIQDVCEQRAKNGTLTVGYVRDILNRYLWTATVTKRRT